MFARLVPWVTGFISHLGYAGIFVLMAMESMIIPLPSELVMPFAGFLVSQGTFSFWIVALVAALGTLAGSIISYYIGYYGGTPLVKRYGKWVLIEPSDLTKTQRWFGKYGARAVFFCRFVPVVRHISSMPAGAAKMDIRRFCIATFIGGLIWNSILLEVGVLLGDHWESLSRYSSVIDVVIVVLVVAAAIYVWHRHFRRRRVHKK